MTSAVRLEEPVSVPHAVKDAQPHERAPATTYNPYLAARHEWDERYGNLITRERNWRLMALLCAAIALVAIGGVIRLSTKTHIVPFVVAMDSLGRTMAAGPAEETSTSDDRLKRATLFTWVEDLRTVTTRRDRPAEGHRPRIRAHRQRRASAGLHQRVLSIRPATEARLDGNRERRSAGQYCRPVSGLSKSNGWRPPATSTVR